MSIAIFYPLGFRPMSLVILQSCCANRHRALRRILLTIEVYGTELRWYFGLGLWRKRVSLTEIASLARVPFALVVWNWRENTPRAWIYLVAPGEGIEITLTSGKALRIGTGRRRRAPAALANETTLTITTPHLR